MSSTVRNTLLAATAMEDASQYILSAVAGQIDPSRAGVAHEVSQDEAQRLRDANIGVNGTGVLLPPDLVMAARLDSTTAGAGREGIFKQIETAPALRPHSRAVQLGMRTPIAQRVVQLCVFENGAGVQYVGEDPGSDLSDGDRVLRSEVLTPRTAAGSFSHTSLLAGNLHPDAAELLAFDLRAAVAEAIDKGAVAGSGANGEPTGVIHRNDIGSVTIDVNGGVPTYDAIVALERDVADANGDAGALGFLTSSRMRAQLRRTAVLADTAAGPVWRGNTMLGHPALVSNTIPDDLTKGTSNDCSAIVFGDWSQVVTPIYGIEVLVDKYALKKQGVIEVMVYVYVGTGVAQPAALAAIRDARVS